jgi:hypothetical protein
VTSIQHQATRRSKALNLRIPLRLTLERVLQFFCFAHLAVLALLSLVAPAQRAYPYLAYASFLACAFLLLLLNPRLLVLKDPRAVDVLPLLSIVVWVYGLLMGLLGGYPNAAVFSNFAGIVFYGSYYLLLLSRADAHKTLKFTVWLALLYSVAMAISMLRGAGSSLQLEMFDEIGLSAVRLGWSSSLSLSLVVVALAYARLIDLLPRARPGGLFRGGKLLALSTFMVGSIPVIGTASKGFIIAYGLILVLLTTSRFYRDLRFLRIRSSILVVALTGLAILFWYLDEIITVASVLLFLETSPDSVRSIQGAELIADFTWFGKGLGASLPSGYSRDALGYGFELTFHNIIHKFGLLSLLHLPIMILPALMSAAAILRHRNLESSIVAFALMMFLIPGYGNPVLHGPLNALINCFALFLVSRSCEGTMPASKINIDIANGQN